MSLLATRTLFIKLSGRDDLDAAEGASTADADAYIRAGSKALDIESDHRLSIRYYTGTLAADAYLLQLTDCRAVRAVWYYDTDSTKWLKLEKATYEELLDEYPEYDSTTSGTPAMWALDIIHRDSTNQEATPLMSKVGLVILPPPDADITVKVFGKFYEKTLTLEADFNYWSEVHPQLLVYAALRELEVSYRNTQGYRDWDTRIKEYLFNLDKDGAEEPLGYVPEMEG